MQGLGFLLRCQENDLLGHGCRLPPWHSPIPNWYSSISMYNACLILTADSAFISSSPSTPFIHCQMDENSWTHARCGPVNLKKNPIWRAGNDNCTDHNHFHCLFMIYVCKCKVKVALFCVPAPKCYNGTLIHFLDPCSSAKWIGST